MKNSMILSIVIMMSCAANAQCLEDLQWKNRVLIINAIDTSDQLYQKQINLFQDESEALRERKLNVFQYTYPHLRQLDFSQKKNSKNRNTKDCEFIIKEDFNVILIGLDGGVKLRSKKILTPEKLYAKIDAMPMRRSEMKGN